MMRNFLSILNELEIGGSVEDHSLRDLDSMDFSTDQLDLFKEVPTLEPNLPNGFVFKGRIGTYFIVEDKRSAHSGIMLYLFDKNKPFAFIQLQDDKSDIAVHGPGNRKGYQTKAIYIEPEYRGQKIAIKLYEWVLHNLCYYLAADELHTRYGVRLWKKLLSCRRLKCEVWDQNKCQSRRRWSGKDFNRVYNSYHLTPYVTLPGRDIELWDDE